MRVLLCLAFLCGLTAAAADGGRVLKGHERWVLALALSPDGKTLASGGDDHSLRIWDLEKRR